MVGAGSRATPRVNLSKLNRDAVIVALFVAAFPSTARAADEPLPPFRFEVRGYAQLDYVQAFQGVDPNWQAAVRPSRIATDESVYGTSPNATLSVRQSRLGVYADFLAAGDYVHTEFEFDLFGVGKDEGQTTIRPRHMFGEWRWILAGQTNSLFMDGDIFPNFIEYWGPAGMVLYRNPQLRLTPLRGTNTLAFAVERPGTVIDQGVFPGAYESQAPVPDFTLQYRFTTEQGHLQAAGLVRELGYRTTTAPERKGNVVGWGAHVSSVQTMGAAHPSATFRLSAVYGHGIANYMNDGGTDIAPTSSGVFEAQPLLGLVGYVDLSFTEMFGASLGYSSTQVRNSGGQADDAFHRGDYASVTLLHTPVPTVLAGIGYTWARRTDDDGAVGIDQRAQLTLKYSFSSLSKP